MSESDRTADIRAGTVTAAHRPELDGIPASEALEPAEVLRSAIDEPEGPSPPSREPSRIDAREATVLNGWFG